MMKCSVCEVSLSEEFTTSVILDVTKIATFTGLVVLTMMTGSILLKIGGTGSAFVINPLQKQITGQHLTIKDTVENVAFGATIGIG
jgi:hypothetical protein